MAKFAGKLKELREKKDLSVRAFARELGKSPGYISRVEGRGEMPSMDFVIAVASFFEIDVETLLELLKSDQLSKTEREIDLRHKETVKLFRRGSK